MKCKFAALFFASLGMLAASVPALAGGASGTVQYIIVRPGLTYFSLNGVPQGRPTCAANTLYYMIKDETSASGKQQFALVMAAKVSGRTIGVDGAGQCTKYPDGEDALNVYLQ